MKRTWTTVVFAALMMAILGGTGAFAQMPFLMGEPVKVGMGELGIDGVVLSGAKATSKEQKGEETTWTTGLVNPIWQENRVEFDISYKILNYGAFVSLVSQNYGMNGLGTLGFRNALVYVNMFNEKVKASGGWLHDFLMPVSGSRIWQTESDGDTFRFTNEGRPSLRLEIKAIEGLNFGFQYFFIDHEKDFGPNELWKEFGIGANYNSERFNAQAGIRFDSKGDDLSREDVKSYLTEYYGDTNYIPHASVAGFKHIDSEKDGYDGGTWAFVGFKLNGIKNLTLDGHAGFYNLGAFDKLGYGKIVERVGYDNLFINGFGVSLVLYQEFYGSDVIKDDYINAPFLQFTPGVSYKISDKLTGSLEGTIGAAPDVLNNYWSVEPKLAVALNPFGLCSLELYYNITHKDYTKSDLEPITEHTIGLALMLIF
ncbi:MAG: hypothetical protein LBF60_08985 [Treponema sp.]|jgi:hypothetical protein|nr:hypothetical protein [Treponema sp.]